MKRLWTGIAAILSALILCACERSAPVEIPSENTNQSISEQIDPLPSPPVDKTISGTPLNGGYSIVTLEYDRPAVLNPWGEYILGKEYILESITPLEGLNAVSVRKYGDSVDIYYNLYPEYALGAGNVSAMYPYEKPFSAVSLDNGSHVVADNNKRVLLGPMHKIAILENGTVEAYRTPESTSPEYFTIDDMGNVFPLNQSDHNSNAGESGKAPIPRKEGDLYGYADVSGSAVIPARFEYARDFEGDYAVVNDNFGGLGLINRQGAYILPPDFADIYTDNVDGVTFANSLSGADRYFVLEGNSAKEISGVSASLNLYDYKPNEGGLVAVLGEEPTLNKRVSNEHRLPCTDGATALFPVYSAFVQAVYPEDTRYEYVSDQTQAPLITCTRTNEAYERLVNGVADIIFVAEPSDAQVADAAAKGVEFELTPFGREAFVFIVNQSNPLESITVDQIRDIYSGKTTAWDALGISGLGGIMAYQRPENSGSQTALQKLMGDVPLMKAPEGVVAWDMGDIIETIEYRNLPNAIGYTFRFFCSELVNNDVKMLSVNGVAPTVENIRNGTYPITSTLYAVTRKGDENPNTAAFLEWIQSPQGMELVEKSGYVPWYEPAFDLGAFGDPA